MNHYAAQIAAGNYAIWQVCQCCMLCHANGECCAEAHDTEPLSRVPAGADVSMGTLEHRETCAPADRADGCDCGALGFCMTSCDECGSPYPGDRFALIAVYGMREVTL